MLFPAFETKWHALKAEEVFKILNTGENGLSADEAGRRLKLNGPNKLPESKPTSVALIFIRQFQSPLIYMLLLASLAVFIMGELADAAVIAAVLLLNAVIGSIQEGRAQNTLASLKKFVETKAFVLRGGVDLISPDAGVVPGDVIILQEGDKVPADARIISDRNLKIDESAFTGESAAVHKTSETLADPELPVIEQKNMVFKGSNIAGGSGRAAVVRTGSETVIGKIARQVASMDTEIPLKANIRELSRLLIAATILIAAAIFILGIWFGMPAQTMLATVISISVSIIPEGLPIAITIVLAAGVWRMSKKNALVKRLQAVEALGQARIIAVDKTGTLTRNEMMVQELYAGGRHFDISGSGYDTRGEAREEGSPIERERSPVLALAARVASYCANARVMRDESTGEWKTSGDPTEAALYVFGEKLGARKDTIEQSSPLIDEIPFDYSLKYHATLHRENEGGFVTVVGAPEVVLKACIALWQEDGPANFSQDERGRMTGIFSEFSAKGLRVLAFAIKELKADKLSRDDIRDLTFVGFFGLRDALRPEARAATQRAINSGIKVVMVTGDHPITAAAIAREAGIWKLGDKSLTGAEVSELTDKDLADRLEGVTVFARVTPEHKLRIIKAYKSKGDVVAMTGDGVNDAPSLVAADLGVAMGRIGTEVAKEASDIVLLDDNFGSIISAVEEGRNIYRTIKKVILYLLSTSLGELLVIIGAILVGLPLPLLPVQIIWLNFVTDGFFTAALALEPKEKGLLSEKFEKPKKYLIDSLMSKRMIIMSLPMMIMTLILFGHYLSADAAKALTVSLTILAVFQWANAWNCRSESDSIFERAGRNLYMIYATVGALSFQLLAIYHPFFQKYLHTTPLDLADWLVIIALSTSIIIVEEIRKYLSWRRKERLSSSVRPLRAKAI
jgi:Ca2+-transporting ATPase